MSYKCPICKDGIFNISITRNGSPGFRMTDYDLHSQTCDCDVFPNEVNLMAIVSYKEEGYNVKCDCCDKEIAVIEFDDYIKDENDNYHYKESMICAKCFEDIAKKDPSES